MNNFPYYRETFHGSTGNFSRTTMKLFMGQKCFWDSVFSSLFHIFITSVLLWKGMKAFYHSSVAFLFWLSKKQEFAFGGNLGLTVTIAIWKHTQKGAANKEFLF
jgi:hypothetical protein